MRPGRLAPLHVRVDALTGVVPVAGEDPPGAREGVFRLGDRARHVPVSGDPGVPGENLPAGPLIPGLAVLVAGDVCLPDREPPCAPGDVVDGRHVRRWVAPAYPAERHD